MKYLFVAYCIGGSQGQPQIGAYKRGLRLALELSNRGHEVSFFCTGRHNFHDSLTDLAEKKLAFVEFPFLPAKGKGAEYNRANFLSHLQMLQPDIVVIGDAPLAGTLLETTLCAVELGIPTVCLDNAYRPIFADLFCRRHGAMFDGIILSGPSALHGKSSYPPLLQVPPLITPSRDAAKVLISNQLGLRGRRLIVVLAYDQNVQRLGISLLERLASPDVDVVFVSSTPEEVSAHLRELPPPIASHARAIAAPEDGLLFGLLQVAHCAVTKCAFMQVTESLSLHTPVIGYYYSGYFSMNDLPKVFKKFTHATRTPVADEVTVRAARRFLDMDPEKLRLVHNGDQGGAAMAATFLEKLPRLPRQGTDKESARLGFSKSHLIKALTNLEAYGRPAIEQVRCSGLRSMPDHEVYILTCAYRINGNRGFVRLWGRLFRSPTSLLAEARRARQPGSNRQVLYSSWRHRMLIEVDMGEESLPSIQELAHFQN
jgi:hypothetical protein